VPARPSTAAPQFLLPLSLVDLTRELASMSERDARFERAAALAAELEEELRRLTGETGPRRTRRRRAAAPRPARTPRASARLLEAFEAEMHALGTICQRIDEHGLTISTHQLSDLRLGEKTRRIFVEAGLTYVQDVADLTAEQALEIPQLAPAAVAEVRAAIMFAIERAGAKVQPMLPAPGQNGDLFDGLVQGVNQLPPREREVVVLRTGVGDRVHDVDEVAHAIGCAVEQVPQLERHALNMLLAQPASVEACWRLEELCAQLGLRWDDERLPTVVAVRYPKTRASFTRLVSWLMREKGQLAADAGGLSFNVPPGIEHFEEMVVAAIGRYGDLSEIDLRNHVKAGLTPVEREHYADVNVPERVQILGPAQQSEDGRFRLPDAPIAGVDDRHIRALNGLIGALQRLGTARIASLTTEVNRRLPKAYQVNDQYIKTWLTRHPELFTETDPERFKLASLDVDILCGLATSWVPGEIGQTLAATRPSSVAAERLHERVANEIAGFLRDNGPQPIGRIRSHLYGRFIGLASADTVITQSPHRFTRQPGPGGLIALRDGDEARGAEGEPAKRPGSPPRVHFWQRR
jgi:hypothetical protein